MISTFTKMLLFVLAVTGTSIFVCSYQFYHIYIDSHSYFYAWLKYSSVSANVYLLVGSLLLLSLFVFLLVIALVMGILEFPEVYEAYSKSMPYLLQLVFCLYINQAKTQIQQPQKLYFKMLIYTYLIIAHELIYCRCKQLLQTHILEKQTISFKYLFFIFVVLLIDFGAVMHQPNNNIINALISLLLMELQIRLIGFLIDYLMHMAEVYMLMNMHHFDLIVYYLRLGCNIFLITFKLLTMLNIWNKFDKHKSLEMYLLLFSYTLYVQIKQLSIINRKIKDINCTEKLTVLSATQIEALSDHVCIVCLYEMQEQQEIVILSCSHAFHKVCIRQWIIRNSDPFCPKCKVKLNYRPYKPSSEDWEDSYQLGTDIEDGQIDMQGIVHDQYKDIVKLDLLRAGDNFLMKNLHPAKKDMKSLPQIGSVPFGLPRAAVCHRRKIDIVERNKIVALNRKMMSLMAMESTKQLLLVPQS